MTDLDKSVLSLPKEKDEPVTHEYLHQDEPPDVVASRKKEAALVRKLDCFVAPVMMMLMLISYLDRGNIGFAATQGMTKDIGLKGSQLNVSQTSLLSNPLTTNTINPPQTAISVFYIFYILAEVPPPPLPSNPPYKPNLNSSQPQSS